MVSAKFFYEKAPFLDFFDFQRGIKSGRNFCPEKFCFFKNAWSVYLWEHKMLKAYRHFLA